MSVLERASHTARRVRASVRDVHERHRERHRPSGYRFAIADGIAMINPFDWDAVTGGRSVFLGRRFLEIVERHPPEGIRFHYGVVYTAEGSPAAAVVVQSFDLRASDLVAAPARRPRIAALSAIEERVLVCGNLLSWGFHGVAFHPAVEPRAVWPGVLEALYRMRRADKLTGQPGVVLVKDLPSDVDTLQTAAIERFSYRAVETEPDMVLTLDPSWRTFEDYLQSLKGDYRKRARKVQRELDGAGIRLSRLDAAGWETHGAELHQLYVQVRAHQKVRIAALSPAFLPALSQAYGPGFLTTVAQTATGRAVGFVATLRDGEGAVGYYVGYDREVAGRGAPLYHGLLMSVVEHGIELGARSISFGRTALDAKARLGARPRPMRCYLRHRAPAVNWLVKGLLQALPSPAPAPERHPFKEGGVAGEGALTRPR